MAFVECLWDASDQDDNECELVQVSSLDKPFQLSMTKGHWSGYPTIALDRKQLKDLGDAIETALEKG